MQATHIPERVAHRAANRYVLDSSTGCHFSTYSTGSHGYAQIGWHENGERVVTLVHRVVWAAAFGPIPEGMTVDHMCKQRRCCNLTHLRLLSNFENGRRTSGRDWPLGRCIAGHPNSELIRQPGGKRLCRLCNLEWQRRYRANRKATA